MTWRFLTYSEYPLRDRQIMDWELRKNWGVAAHPPEIHLEINMIEENKLKAARTLAVIEEEMTKAEKELEERVRQSEAARRDETSARNRLNNLQKEFDVQVLKRKKDAPRDTDWADSKRNWTPGGEAGEGLSIKGVK